MVECILSMLKALGSTKDTQDPSLPKFFKKGTLTLEMWIIATIVARQISKNYGPLNMFQTKKNVLQASTYLLCHNPMNLVDERTEI